MRMVFGGEGEENGKQDGEEEVGRDGVDVGTGGEGDGRVFWDSPDEEVCRGRRRTRPSVGGMPHSGQRAKTT